MAMYFKEAIKILYSMISTLLHYLFQVAHAFLLGSKYSTIFKAQYIDEQNQKKWVHFVLTFFSTNRIKNFC